MIQIGRVCAHYGVLPHVYARTLPSMEALSFDVRVMEATRAWTVEGNDRDLDKMAATSKDKNGEFHSDFMTAKVMRWQGRTSFR